MTSKCTELSIGNGRDRMAKGSKRTLSWPHTLQVTFDLSCPWNRSTITDLEMRERGRLMAQCPQQKRYRI